MAADPATIAAIRQWVGSTPDDNALSAGYDALGSAEGVALQILQTRRADLVAGGPSFSISGHYSQGSPAELLKAIDGQIDALIYALGCGSGLETYQLARSDRARPC